MQQFFLFYTMLIVASETFSKELHGRQSTGGTRKFSRFPPKQKYPNSNRLMFDEFNSPMILLPSSYEVSDRQTPFLSPLFRRVSRRKVFLRNSFHPETKSIINKRLCTKKFLRRWKRWPLFASSFAFNSPQCFENYRLIRPGFRWGLHRHLSSAFRHSFEPSVWNRNPKHYVCVYPVFDNNNKQLKKVTIPILKTPRVKEQRLLYTSAGRKSKRSANTTTTEQPAPTEKITKELPPLKPSTTPSPLQLSYPYYHNDILDHTEPELIFQRPRYRTLPRLAYPDFNSGHLLHLEVTQPPLPRITFKYPYDPNIYESSLQIDNDLSLKKKEQNEEVEEKQQERFPDSIKTDMGRLKDRLQEVESALKCGRCDDTEDKEKNKDDESSEKKKKKKKKKKKNGNGAEKGEKKTKPNKGFSCFSYFSKKKNEEKKEKNGKVSTSNDTTPSNLKEKIDNVAIPILAQISKVLGKLETAESSSSSNSASNSSDAASSNSTSNNSTAEKEKSKTSNVRCSPDGTWTSSTLGIDLMFTMLPNMMLKVKVTSKAGTPVDEKWSIHGLTLSKFGGPLMLAAVYPQKRKIASFMGQCKMCKDQDLIFGSWTIFTGVRRFSELWSAVETKPDILKKKKETA